jgi:hypothetical protein
MMKFYTEKWTPGERPILTKIDTPGNVIVIHLGNGAIMRISDWEQNGLCIQTHHAAMSDPMVITPQTRHEIIIQVGERNSCLATTDLLAFVEESDA